MFELLYPLTILDIQYRAHCRCHFATATTIVDCHPNIGSVYYLHNNRFSINIYIAIFPCSHLQGKKRDRSPLPPHSSIASL